MVDRLRLVDRRRGLDYASAMQTNQWRTVAISIAGFAVILIVSLVARQADVIEACSWGVVGVTVAAAGKSGWEHMSKAKALTPDKVVDAIRIATAAKKNA